MHPFKTLSLAALLALGSALSVQAQATDPAKAQGTGASAPAADLTEGEIRKVDKENRKLTIRHGEIRNLQMPGMTMVFQVRDPAVLDQVKVGDKVRFKVERGATGLLVTELQPAAR
ncbi:MAG TPA: copper-binding protein [Burkholderiaceae bacterium]|nr:copper-binding protein [Burkholderiaceae bacterium]